MKNVIILFFSAFFLCFYLMPYLIRIANKYSIYDYPNHIKLHLKRSPFLGSIALVFAFYIPITVIAPIFFDSYIKIDILLISLFAIFILGLADDLLTINPKKKLFCQLFLNTAIIYKCNIHLPYRELLCGIGLNSATIFAIGVIILTGIMNAFNLLDGSDGILASISLIGAVVYSCIFYFNGQLVYASFAITLSGSLLAFLFYNKPPAHIFMGDAGSLFLGLLFCFFTFYFIDQGGSFTPLSTNSRAVLAYTLIALPVLDMVRLFVFRLIKFKNPLKGDNNHIHHLLLKSGFTSNQVLIVLASYQLVFIGIAYLLINTPLYLFIMSSLIAYLILVYLLENHIRHKVIKLA
jgi:UDP-GlcNAc:undecaprenyl-phosphate/decaprenyl-phosphate GlcNAc-1-phosphate transferase